jgi:hypothetical protein
VVQSSGDVQARAQPARVTMTAGTVSVAMRTHLWISWARIALKHEAMAHAARQEMQQLGADQSRLLGQEADAGLVGICAAAFALEALSRELDELGVIPQAMLTAWQNSPPSADKQVLEILKHSVDPRGLVTIWARELEWLFGLRGSSVHYRGMNEPPQLHPLGMNVAPSQVAYSAENATRAVDLLLGILERCRDKPKPPARNWSKEMRGAVEELIGRRGHAV